METVMRRAASLVEQIEALGTTVDTPGPASEQLIRQVERTIDLQLPAAYRSFLRRYGAIFIDDRQIAGIWDADPQSQSRGNVHACTQEARRELGLEPAYVVLDIQDDEYLVCLDTSRAAEGDCPVIGIDRPPMTGRSEKAGTFAQYLVQFLEQHLAQAKSFAEWEQARLRE